MKKRWFLAGLLMLLLLAFCVFRPNMARADEQTVTLTINGNSGRVSLLSEEDVRIVVRAPGATAVRIWSPDREEFEYYDRYEPLGYLEVTWSYANAANNQSVFAEARYDDYSEDVDFWDEPESVWTTQSNSVLLRISTPNGALDPPDVSLESNTVAQGSWLHAHIDTPLGLDEWYWAEVVQQDENGDDGEYQNHFDFDDTDSLYIQATQFEPGDYIMYVYNGAPGYEHGEARLNFTVTEGDFSEGLRISQETAPVNVDITLFGYAQGADHLVLHMTRDGWRDDRILDGEMNQTCMHADQPGTYTIEMEAWQDGILIMEDSGEVTFTVPEENGMLSRPDFSGLTGGEDSPVLLSDAGLSGTIGVDSHTRWLNVSLDYRPVDDEWETIYRADRSAGSAGWTSFDLPADLFTREGRYVFHAHVNGPGYEGNHAEYSFFRLNNVNDGVTITLNAPSTDVLANQDYLFTVSAPGATAVRIWDSDCNGYGYYERVDSPAYMEIRRNCSEGYYSIYAQARYDDYSGDYDLSEDDDSAWTATSNVLVLNSEAPYGLLDEPAAVLDSDTVARGSWLTARITQTQGVNEWYWADIMRFTEDEDEDWLDHFDFDAENEIFVPTGMYEPGDYFLVVQDAAPGYENNEIRLPFTIEENDIPQGLSVSSETAPISSEITVFAYVPGADSMEIRITRQNDPGWNDERWMDGEMNWDHFRYGEPDLYTLELKAWQGDEIFYTQTAEITLVNENGRLQKADLSDFPAILGADESFAGTIGADPRTEHIDITFEYRPDDGDWQDFFWIDRWNTDGENWTTLDLPASLFEQPGWYLMRVDVNADGIQGNGSRYSFFRSDDTGNDIVLTVNGSTQDIPDMQSHADFNVSVTSQTATAVRILNNDWWDYEDMPGGRISRNYNYNSGDYTIVAQMTTAEPVWREDGFDWRSFSWEDLEWTDLSNAVKVHVTSPNGTLEAPQVTMTPSGEVERGEWIEIQAEPQGYGEWLWADLRRWNDEDNPEYPWWEDIDHYDSDGDLKIRIPTLLLEPGDYQLQIGAGAIGFDNSDDTCLYFTLLESDNMPEAELLLSRDTMPASAGLQFWVYAPGADHIHVDVLWDRDSNWSNWYDTGSDTDRWDWGCGQSGEYTFVMKAWFPDAEEPVTVTRTLTVTADGDLEQPVLTDVPSLLYVGDEIHGSFQDIENAGWYNVELNYTDGDWLQLYRDDRNPSQENATALDFGPEYFTQPGTYELSVNAAAVGINNGYCSRQILVLEPGEASGDLVISYDGSADPETVHDVYLYEEPEISVSMPENITAIRIWTGEYWATWFMPGENSFFSVNASQEGLLSVVAQASTDPAVAQWMEDHDGDFSDFDIGQIDWSMTSNLLSFNVICDGDLAAPVVHMPEGNTVRRGEVLEFSFEGVENAFVYGVEIRRQNSEWWENPVFNAEYVEPSTVRIPTDTIEPGAYIVRIDPRRYGWRGHVAAAALTVTQSDAWTDEPSFYIDKTSVLTGEDFLISIYAPGSEEIRLCHEDFENDWADEDTDRFLAHRRCFNAGEYRFYAYARYEGSGWQQIGDVITVTASAPNGMLDGFITAPSIISEDEELSYSITWRHLGNWSLDRDFALLNEDDENVLMTMGDALSFHVEEGEEEDVVYYTIPAGTLSPGLYRIRGFIRPDAQGYNETRVTKLIYVTEAGDAPNGDLYGPRIFMDGVWTEGDDLSFEVIPDGGEDAEWIKVWITDPAIQNEDGEELVLFGDDELNPDHWDYNIPASYNLFVPGHWYRLHVISAASGYNPNETTFDICMMPADPDTLVLPAALSEVDEEAFAGTSAQKLVIPDTVTSVASRAFADCTGLLLVELPSDCSGIAHDAFQGSGPIMTYAPPESSAEQNFWDSEEINIFYLR